MSELDFRKVMRQSYARKILKTGDKESSRTLNGSLRSVGMERMTQVRDVKKGSEDFHSVLNLGNK